jgi:intracellular septation protein
MTPSGANVRSEQNGSSYHTTTPPLPAAADFKSASQGWRLIARCGRKIKVGGRGAIEAYTEREEINAMRTALVQLLSDFLSAIVFLIIYSGTGNLYLATGAAITTSLAQFAVAKIRSRPVDAMQWLILGMVVLLGSATLITQDSRFIMVKPSIVHFAIGAVMLRRGWMMRYLPPIARDNIPESVLVGAGYAWAVLMCGLGTLNIIITVTLPFAVWAWFISVGAIGAKIAAFLLQYVIFRTIIRRKLRGAAAGGPAVL